jgi:hypothetical protein
MNNSSKKPMTAPGSPGRTRILARADIAFDDHPRNSSQREETPPWANPLVGILHGCRHNHTNYDEHTAWASGRPVSRVQLSPPCRPSRWKQRQVLIPAAIITSVLLLCDAWFDVLTANGHRQLIVSIATALVGELPLAAVLCLVSIRALRMAGRAPRGLPPSAPVSPLWRTPFFTTPSRPSMRRSNR